MAGKALFDIKDYARAHTRLAACTGARARFLGLYSLYLVRASRSLSAGACTNAPQGQRTPGAPEVACR
jgi:hypothetical protein